MLVRLISLMIAFMWNIEYSEEITYGLASLSFFEMILVAAFGITYYFERKGY